MSSHDHHIMMNLKLGRWSDQRPLRSYELEREWMDRHKPASGPAGGRDHQTTRWVHRILGRWFLRRRGSRHC